MQYSVKLTMLMKTQIGQTLWKMQSLRGDPRADHAHAIVQRCQESKGRGLRQKSRGKTFVLVLRYFRPAALPRSEVSNFTRMRQS